MLNKQTVVTHKTDTDIGHHVLILRFEDVGVTLKNLFRRVTWAIATMTESVV